MMRKFVLFFITTFCLLIIGTNVSAQSLDAFKRQLCEPTPSGACMTITENGEAAQAVRQAARPNGRMTIRGYRVCVFFDNGQEARAGAVQARDLLREHFPETKSYMVYENPYFKVTAGNCLTAEEAILLKGRLLSIFPKAFVKNEELTLADFLN